MVKVHHEWDKGANLEAHSRQKHKILREYFFNYLIVRCKLPQQTRFRLAIIDGFAGGGRYKCGAAGSPLIFIEELKRATEAVNIDRAVQGIGSIDVECLLIFNDSSKDAIELLKSNVAPMQADIIETCPKLHLQFEYLNQAFEVAYPTIKSFLEQGRYRNVIFNLDQYGDVHVNHNTLINIMQSYKSAEIFYTLMIGSLLTFLQKNDPDKIAKRLEHLGVKGNDIMSQHGLMSKNEFLGGAEKIVFEALTPCAPYVSPFAINNPDGWRYWLIHFANSYRARQVYNNILHDNASFQAHFGRSGLNMLSYDPQHGEGMLYLFDNDGRARAKEQLLEDIPRSVMETGDAMLMTEFYESIYNQTPAHADDIHAAMIEHPDLMVITGSGGERRKATTIEAGDTIKIKVQRSLFPLLKGFGDIKN